MKDTEGSKGCWGWVGEKSVQQALGNHRRHRETAWLPQPFSALCAV